MTATKPPAVEDSYQYWTELPTKFSPRCIWWLAKIERGWRANRRIRQMGCEEAARWFGVFIAEYTDLIGPAARDVTGEDDEIANTN